MMQAATLLALFIIGLAGSRQVGALSSHSPIDLYAFPRYHVSLGQQGVLNDTVADSLAESAVEQAKYEPNSARAQRRHLVRTPAGQAFLCTVPSTTSDYEPHAAVKRHEIDVQTRQLESERGLERGLELLEPMRGGCLYLRQNWFTYSFCYGDKIRQFHAEHTPGSAVPIEDSKADAYTLGYSPEPVSTVAPKYGSGSSALDRKHQKTPSALAGGGFGADGQGGVTELGGIGGWDATQGGRYLTQTWDEGTVCDKTGMPRTVEVQFHCNTGTMDRIALIRETAICRYVMIIYTPRLCSEPIFLEGRDASTEPTQQIDCQPVVSKLRSMVDAADSSKLASLDPTTSAAEPEADDSTHATTVGLDVMLDSENPDRKDESRGPMLDVDVTLAVDHSKAVEQGIAMDGVEDEVVDVLTVVYDTETGEIHTSGADVTNEELEAALQGRPLSQQEDSGREEPAEGPTVQSLEALTKLMRESIAEALRQHGLGSESTQQPEDADERLETTAEGGPPARRGALAPRDAQQDQPLPPKTNAANQADERRSSAGSPPAMSLKEILDNLAAGMHGATAQRPVLKRDVLGEAEHRALFKQFQQLYDNGEDESADVSDGEKDSVGNQMDDPDRLGRATQTDHLRDEL